jgi:hypothetical protein
VKLSDDCDLVLEIDNNKLQNFMVKLVLKTSPKAEEIVIRLVKNDTTIETTNSDLLNLRSFFKEHQNDKTFYRN